MPRPPAPVVLLVSTLVLVAWFAPAPPRLRELHAQVRPVYSMGVAGALQSIERLRTTASALHTAAHPDDEDTAFITRVARGDDARVAYLSLNRGEGGQNVIGPELFEALGVIRTEELLQARALDGGEQFFTRTYDFGFSKRTEEAAEAASARTIGTVGCRSETSTRSRRSTRVTCRRSRRPTRASRRSAAGR